MGSNNKFYPLYIEISDYWILLMKLYSFKLSFIFNVGKYV